MSTPDSDAKKLLQMAAFVDAVDNVKEERLVVVNTNGGEGSYIVSASGADCFATLLKALGYTAEIEELNGEDSSKDEAF